MDKTENFIYIVAVIIIILLISTIMFTMGDNMKRNDYCINQGYDGTVDLILDTTIEPGYIRCCSLTYINHIQEKVCDVIKWEG